MRIQRTMKHLVAGVVIALMLTTLAGGCAKPKFIPRTKVKDIPVNREVIRVMEKYRRAVVDSDAARVLALVHPLYQDNAGTPNGADDIDFEKLKSVLGTQYKNTGKIRMRIEYLSVQTKGSLARVDTWIDATFVYSHPEAKQRWRRLTDSNRFRLIKDDKGWRFLSGL